MLSVCRYKHTSDSEIKNDINISLGHRYSDQGDLGGDSDRHISFVRIHWVYCGTPRDSH